MTDLDELIDLVGRHAPGDGGHDTPLSGLKLHRSASPTMPIPVIYEPTLCLVVQGRKQAVLADKSYIYDPTCYLMASVDLPVMGSVIEATEDRPYLSLQIDLDMDKISELILRYPEQTSKPQAGAQGLSLNRMTPPLFDAAVRLTRLLDAPRDIDALAPLATDEILYRLLNGESGPTLRQMAQADSRLNQIARAILWIKTNFREACPIEKAAEIAGMSRSSFHVHFKATTSLSPLEYRTRLRIQEAQRLMVSTGMDAAAAGFSVGYGSPSQFSRDYSRIFGLPPAMHVSRLLAQRFPSPNRPSTSVAA